jgi:choline dehydrogenase-like flavoprotein
LEDEVIWKKKILLSLCCFTVTTSQCLQADCRNESSESDINVADYVIVGVGTAGGLMAKFLSDDKTSSVIALHNGENLTDDPLIKLSKNAKFTVLAALLGSLNPFANIPNIPPKLASKLAAFFGPNNTAGVPFLYQIGDSTPQPGADFRMISWQLSLPEGGASSINAGAWCRGTNEVYSQWESIVGPEWSANRILAIYKKLENYHGLTTDSFQRGYHGPISVLQARHPSKLSKKFTKAIVKGATVPYVLDYNDSFTPIGASTRVQATQSGHNGRYRASSATAFLNRHVMTPSGHGVKDRKLEVLFNSTALRVLWEGNKAVGVEFVQNGQIKQVFANKGVVVCAGLFSSSFLLHSGVGAAPLLSSLGIPVIFDNANVGQGLADEQILPLVFLSNPKDSPSFNSNDVFASIAWLPNPLGDPSIRAFRFSTASQIPGITLALIDLIKPQSRGSITINSANPLDPPVIDMGILSNPNDLAAYQAAMSIFVKQINIQLQEIDPLYELIFPDPAILNDALLTTMFIQQYIISAQCFQSHCLMAPLNQGGVVDSTGHVYGVQNLIVADNSVVPIPMDGTTMATGYLMAANIARLLLGK